MKIFLVIILFLLETIQLYTQQQHWEIISSKKTTDIEFYNNKLYLMDIEGFKTSNDSGKTWNLVFDFEDFSLSNFVIDKNGIFFASHWNSAGIYISSDEGVNWELTSLNVSSEVLEVDSNNTLWVGDGNKLYKTTNQGLNWDSLNIYAYSLNFNSSKGVICSGNNGIYLSSDGGITWDNILQIPGWRVVIIDENDNIFCVGDQEYSRKLMKSINLGLTWSILYDNIGLGAYHLVKIDTTLFMIQGFPYTFADLYRGSENGSALELLGNFYGTWKTYFLLPYILIADETGLFRYDPNYTPYYGSNHFPLNKGNVWQYFREYGFTKFTVGIHSDTTINNKKYYGYKGKWLRYDPDDFKLYIRLNDSDYVHFDYTKRSNESFLRTGLNGVTTGADVVDYGSASIFDSTKLYWTIFYDEGSFRYTFETYYEGIGITDYSSTWPGGGTGLKYEIIRAKLIYGEDTVKFSDHVKPVISFNPILITPSIHNSFVIGTSHSYQNMIMGGGRFIDSVYMNSFYKKGSDTVFNFPISGVWIEEAKTSSIIFNLDTSFINSDYEFYYKIIVNDMGLVSEYSYSPDSGFYNLIYNPTVDVDEEQSPIPTEFKLEQNYPNPFNPSTKISWQSPVGSWQTLKVFDVLGREVATLVDEYKPAGMYNVQFSMNNLSTGIYFYRLQAGEFVETKKMIYLK
jgi:hypothetical protein